MSFNDYSSKQKDQPLSGKNLVEERRNKIKSALSTKLSSIYDLGMRGELAVATFDINFDDNAIDIKIKYCEEYDDYIRYDNLDELDEKTRRLVERCENYEQEIVETVSKILREEKLNSWRPSISRY